MQVGFAAPESLHEESRGMVRDDPANNIHELTMDQGQADVACGSRSDRLGRYEQVTFSASQPGLVWNAIVSPSELLEPANTSLMMAGVPRATGWDFSWSSVPGAMAYHVQVASSLIFSSPVVDKTEDGPHVGPDFRSRRWDLLLDGQFHGNESSGKSAECGRLNLVLEFGAEIRHTWRLPRSPSTEGWPKYTGKAEPVSTVIINNEQVSSSARDGTFRHLCRRCPSSGQTKSRLRRETVRGAQIRCERPS
jgi:hypothetical protein